MCVLQGLKFVLLMRPYTLQAILQADSIAMMIFGLRNQIMLDFYIFQHGY